MEGYILMPDFDQVHHSQMIDLKTIRSVALDIAKSKESYQSQDEISDFIVSLLNRNYKVYLYSTKSPDDLSNDDFSHPDLIFLTEEMPPTQATLQSFPELIDEKTLWVTDDRQMQYWVEESQLPLIYLQGDYSTQKNKMRVPRLSELSALLDPTGMVLSDVGGVVADLKRERNKIPILIGVGGPPRSGYQRFSLDLKNHLQDAGHDLVDLMDLSQLMVSQEDMIAENQFQSRDRIRPEVETWISERLIKPLQGGRPVYYEEPDPALPKEFHIHFPLYISNEAVLILFSDTLFIPPISHGLDLFVLLEVSDQETTRRLYEIPEGENFDPKFTNLFMEREGKFYNEYLRDNQVLQHAGIRIDANHEHAFFLNPKSVSPLN